MKNTIYLMKLLPIHSYTVWFSRHLRSSPGHPPAWKQLKEFDSAHYRLKKSMTFRWRFLIFWYFWTFKVSRTQFILKITLFKNSMIPGIWKSVKINEHQRKNEISWPRVFENRSKLIKIKEKAKFHDPRFLKID